MATVQLTVNRLLTEQQLQNFVLNIELLDKMMGRVERKLDLQSPDATELPSEREMLQMRSFVEEMVGVLTHVHSAIQLEGHPTFDHARRLTTRTRAHHFS